MGSGTTGVGIDLNKKGMKGQLHKMYSELNDTVDYFLQFEAEKLHVNSLIGKEIEIRFEGEIHCISCAKQIPKVFGQGFCYPCFISSPQAAECIIRPELCRAHLGEGRDVAWEEAHHNQPHVVYLAASDIVKVGVTRQTQVPTRWIDQGASSAIIVAETPNRYLAGMLEVAMKEHFSDKTNWQRMLKNMQDDSIDLVAEKWSMEESLPSDLLDYFSENDEVVTLNFPVISYPEKVKSLSLDKDKLIQGRLAGIKGQYIIFDDGRVLNIRKHEGYVVELHIN